MITRETVGDEVLKTTSPNILCELPTGFGKSKIAIDLIQKYAEGKAISRILIVAPRLVLFSNWKAEIEKWGASNLLNYIEFTTYVSFPKRVGNWDIVVFDEAHHLSERCREYLSDFQIEHSILLSATIGRDLKKELKALFTNLYVYKVSARQAIDEEVLPDPKVYLIPLFLDNTLVTHEIVKNKSKSNTITIPYSERWKWKDVKNQKIVIRCTQQQKYDEMSSMISWYKKKMFQEIFKNLYLQKSGERLKWLSEQKTQYVKWLLSKLGNYRTLTFCNGIAQTEELGKYCINSKNKESERNLELFNDGKINHITACNMLDEGMNLKNCKIGVYSVLNSSDRMITQKLGRLLRHPEPVIFIPYYVDTREEEIVQKMKENYNPLLVKTITNLTEITL